MGEHTHEARRWRNLYARKVTHVHPDWLPHLWLIWAWSALVILLVFGTLVYGLVRG
jgi:hypothetical protein